MDYNTQLEKIILPEYGRNIQNMVNHCMTIENREERTACAYSIIHTMSSFYPQLQGVSDFQHTLWDHLAIMSNFELDIDYPYEVIKKEKLITKPGKIDYSSTSSIRFLHYGKIIQEMIEKASAMEVGADRERLEELIANCMKQDYTNFNKDGVDDKKIFDDLANMSKGNILLHNRGIKLSDCKQTISTNEKGKKKKKK